MVRRKPGIPLKIVLARTRKRRKTGRSRKRSGSFLLGIKVWY
jgi:hypothetical protein